MAEHNNSNRDASDSDAISSNKIIEILKDHTIEHKLEMSMWAMRGFAITFSIIYMFPLVGTSSSAYYRVFLATAAVSATRLHQRFPTPSLSKEFFMLLFSEDSCHYLMYSLIFIYIKPLTLAIIPAFLFAYIHFASYSLSLLELIGQNSSCGARILVSLVELQTRKILRFIAFCEIFLMPMTVILVISGKCGLFTPLLYFHFLSMRYASRRNPHTRDMFRDMRVSTEILMNKPSVPQSVRSIVLSFIQLVCKFAPQSQQHTSTTSQ